MQGVLTDIQLLQSFKTQPVLAPDTDVPATVMFGLLIDQIMPLILAIVIPES